MKIRLKEHTINIEVYKNSKYLNFISSNLPIINNNRKEKEKFLKNIYLICTKNAQYQNNVFFKNLIKSSKKHVELIIIDDLIEDEKESLKQSYFLLNSSQNDSLDKIRKKYIKLAKIYHPDRVATKDMYTINQHTIKFQQIQKAYENIKYQIAS